VFTEGLLGNFLESQKETPCEEDPAICNNTDETKGYVTRNNLKPLHQPFFFFSVMVFLEVDLMDCLPGLASNYNPPDLCLLSS
jgi:hypothetical protein